MTGPVGAGHFLHLVASRSEATACHLYYVFFFWFVLEEPSCFLVQADRKENIHVHMTLMRDRKFILNNYKEI